MKKSYKTLLTVTVGTSLFFAVSGIAAAGSGSGSMQDLEQQVKQQQQQLDTQASEIAALKEQLQALLGATQQNKDALTAKVDKEEFDKLNVDKMVVSKQKNVDVTLYGQVNRAALWADNGDASKVYFVDNKNSTTRMGIAAKAKMSDDMSIGGKIEYEATSNLSNKVNQFDEDTDASLDLRHADIYLQSKKMGKLSLGHGSTASDGSAEVDLSGTKVVAYSATDFLAGGQYWYDSNVPWFTVNADGEEVFQGTQISKTIENMDGLSRRDRVRYDTPSFAGFSLGGSAIEDGAFDVAARYERKFGDSKVAAAVAWANPGDLKSWEDQVDGSVSFLHSSGVNVTFAGGQQNYDTDGKDDPNYWYGKLGYRANLFSPGETAFSVDYGMWNDLGINEDEATSIGLAFVQNIKDWGTEFYLAYRLYQLDRTGADLDDVNTIMAGARLKF